MRKSKVGNNIQASHLQAPYLLDLGQRADVVEDPGVVAVQPALGDALLVLGLGWPVAGDGPDALCTR